MRETYKKVVESSNKCFICSSIPTSKNKVNIFRKKSTDLAGIIRSSLEFDVERNTTKTVICLFADSVFSSWLSTKELRKNCEKSNRNCWLPREWAAEGKKTCTRWKHRRSGDDITTVFVDTRLWKTKRPRKRFQNFLQSYVFFWQIGSKSTNRSH